MGIDVNTPQSTLKYVPNPTRPGARKPVDLITDRAKRYRAQADVPAGPRVCGYCGNPSTMVDHIDGHEEHGEPENLMHACRPCNVTKAHIMQAAGLGRKTVQYNPQASWAHSLAQWVWAVSRIRRRDASGRLAPRDAWKTEAPASEVKAAVEMVRATPPAKRAEFAAQLRGKQRRRSSGSNDMTWLTG